MHRFQTPRIRDVRKAMTFIRPHRPSRDELMYNVEIRRGAFLSVTYLSALPQHWQREQAVQLARIIAVQHTHPRCVPTGISAAYLHGARAFDYPGDVHMASLSNSTRSAKVLPAVTLGEEVLASRATIVFHRMLPIANHACRIDGVRSLTLHDALLTLAAQECGALAFSMACSGMRLLIENTRSRSIGFKKRLRTLRQSLSAQFKQLESGHRHRADGSWLFAHADAACESPGESHILWILRSSGLAGIETQYEVTSNGKRFFFDLCFPEARVAIEFDGRFKYGDSDLEIDEATAKQVQRQTQLEADGWQFIRFRWEDLPDYSKILNSVFMLLLQVGVCPATMRRARVHA